MAGDAPPEPGDGQRGRRAVDQGRDGDGNDEQVSVITNIHVLLLDRVDHFGNIIIEPMVSMIGWGRSGHAALHGFGKRGGQGIDGFGKIGVEEPGAACRGDEALPEHGVFRGARIEQNALEVHQPVVQGF